MLLHSQGSLSVFCGGTSALNQFQMGPEERNGMKQNQCGKRNEQNFEQKWALNPFGLNPMVSAFQRTARALFSRRSRLSDADGLGTTR
jgi:hypothetical protein